MGSPFNPKDTFREAAEAIAVGIEALGVVVIVLGGICATVAFLSQVFGRRGILGALHDYRGNLGHSILLGLEFLVAADIVGTVVVDPTFGNVGVLALIIVVRTLLSFALEVEVTGHWPWQRPLLARRESASCGKA